jgi:hypothetical protein
MSETLVTTVLERVKELRETMIATGHHTRAVETSITIASGSAKQRWSRSPWSVT